MFSNDFKPFLSSKFRCEKCDYNTSKKSNWVTHTNSLKHQKSMFSNDFKPFLSSKHICEKCNKEYKDYSGLWRHKKKCVVEKEESKMDISPELVKLITELVKGQNGIQESIIELCKNGTQHITNNTNCHNKTFNLQVFLNETCKDAMNMTTFIDSLQLQLSDLENVGEVGYIEGISRIIVKNLNALDVTQRPVHCTDKKRETMYIKDQDKWEKEDENKTKMHKMVKKVANKNIQLISKFQELHPEWRKITSKVADQMNKIVIEAMGGKGDNDFEKEEKIIKNIAKEVCIDPTFKKSVV